MLSAESHIDIVKVKVSLLSACPVNLAEQFRDTLLHTILYLRILYALNNCHLNLLSIRTERSRNKHYETQELLHILLLYRFFLFYL